MPTRVLEDVESGRRPLETASNEAWWSLAVCADAGSQDRRRAADTALSDHLADPDLFSAVARERARTGSAPVRAGPAETWTARQLEEAYRVALAHQVPPHLRHRLVDLQVDVEAIYANHRAPLRGEPRDDNALLSVLRRSDDVALRREAWEASKEVGAAVAAPVRELARLRNEAARTLGFRDHFALALATAELDEKRLWATLAEVDAVTARPFATWKGRLDESLAARFATRADALAPWHYDDPFFQDLPAAQAPGLDALFASADLEALTRRTFDGIGLQTGPILARSDLRPRPGKSQHAFCIDIDRAGDIRVLANIEADQRWTETMLHEFGHAVYFDGVDRGLPWLLRTMHPLTTEAVAMLFGRLVMSPEWLTRVAGADLPPGSPAAEALGAGSSAHTLLFARWCLVMTHFEHGFYADPDGDHDRRWWDLIERFQLLRRPEGRSRPDWAAKIHVAVAPVYYQNYLYGELFAYQLAETLRRECGGIVERRDVGRLLHERVFRPGASRRWDVLVEEATGEPLSARFLPVHHGGASV